MVLGPAGEARRWVEPATAEEQKSRTGMTRLPWRPLTLRWRAPHRACSSLGSPGTRSCGGLGYPSLLVFGQLLTQGWWEGGSGATRHRKNSESEGVVRWRCLPWLVTASWEAQGLACEEAAVDALEDRGGKRGQRGKDDLEGRWGQLNEMCRRRRAPHDWCGG
ncbi:hypothetical protein NDU88_005666 [Pleurodeles waltl]|uniref:Uncharacterized protein n=1 Tax=Pleurodeles waltl TaxID=8319 RepID=A0AAV7LLV0_PLEWA|nr:hypothetical protein NDU88_005666 [Pleurodeles waltl]